MMDEKKLHEHLAALHQEIGAAKPSDAARRAQMERTAADVRALVTAGPGVDRAQYHGLRERLRALAAAIETDHPKLTASIERVVDMLALYGL